mgnify:CR=1 FL=1
MVGKRRARQLRCHAVCILPFPPTQALFRLSCRLHCHAQDMTGCAAMPCDSRQASRQPHPPPTRRSPLPDEVMLRITPPGLPGPLPSAPRGRPLISLCLRAVTAPRFAARLSRPWNSGLFLRSLRLPGDLALLGRPEAGLTSHRLRGVADDRCSATALPLRLIVPFLCPRPGRLRFAQTAQAGRYRSGHRDPPAASLWTGHVSALLLLMVLREAADTRCAVTAASLRSSFFPAPPPVALVSLGRPEAGLF